MGPRYSIIAYWGPRPESPEACVPRFLRMLEALSGIDPVFGNWHAVRWTGTPLKSMSREDLIKFIADGVSRADDGDPTPQNGYQFGGANGLRRNPRLVDLSIEAGMSIPANFFINTASLLTEPLDDENASFINVEVFRKATLAIATAWDATWCGASHWGMGDLKPKRKRPWFGLEWITYLSSRFAPMVTPPRSAIVERLPDGALLMTATEERFDATNPAHLAIARDIEAALAPINALPWPPDATIDSA